MSYPSNLIAYGSTRTLETDRKMERASNGTTRGRVLFTSPKSKFQVKHENLSPAEFTVFQDFYAANMYAPFTMLWPATGVTYTCIFASDPVETPTLGGAISVSVEVQEV